MDVVDEPMRRLLDYDHRRYWLSNGWSVRFRISQASTSTARPHGIRYAFTLHDLDGTRLLGAPHPALGGRLAGRSRCAPSDTSFMMTGLPSSFCI